MRKLAYETGRTAVLHSFGIRTAMETGPAPRPGDLPPIQPPKWTTRVGTGPSRPFPPGAAAAQEAAGAAPGLLKGLGAKLKGKPLVGAGMALGAGAGLAMMNSSEPQMQVVPSAPIRQYFA